MKARNIFLLLALAAPAYGKQPCSPFHNTLRVLLNEPCGVATTAALFHTAGRDNNIDSRVLISVAEVLTNGGASGCGPIYNDPFHALACGEKFPSFSAAILNASYNLSYYHPQRNLDEMISSEGWISGDQIKATFVDLLGDLSQPVFYSSSCCGDCNSNVQTEIQELIQAVLLAGCVYDCPPLSSCSRADADNNGSIGITDLVRDILSALNGCPAI